MEKIISLFERDYEGHRLVTDVVVLGAEWVIAGEGVATRKWDGTCCLVRNGELFKRYEVKGDRKPPVGFIAVTSPDPHTGKTQGWVPVGDGPEDKWHREGADNTMGAPDGTYELVGPKVQGGAEHKSRHILIRHGVDELPDVQRSFDGLRNYLRRTNIEGIVWHHTDGRMVKIKGRDFGINRYLYERSRA